MEKGKAVCPRGALRVEQSPTPTINREKVCIIINAISTFHSRAGLALPAFAVPANLKIYRCNSVGLHRRPLRAKGKADRKTADFAAITGKLLPFG